MGGRGCTRGGAAPGMQQDNDLAHGAGSTGKLQESGGLSKLFDNHADRPRARVREQIVDVILDAACRFIAGRDGIRDRQGTALQHHGEHTGHCPALTHNRDAWLPVERQRRSLDEGECHAIDMIDQPETVRTFDDHLVLGGDARDLTLFLSTRLPAFGESGGENDR